MLGVTRGGPRSLSIRRLDVMSQAWDAGGTRLIQRPICDLGGKSRRRSSAEPLVTQLSQLRKAWGKTSPVVGAGNMGGALLSLLA